MGWHPKGAEPREDSYVQPRGQRVSSVDAEALARSLERGLDSVPDDIQPLSGADFGDEHTLSLLTQVERGGAPRGTVVTAARELMSGPPKAEARELVAFLRRGAFTLSTGP